MKIRSAIEKGIEAQNAKKILEAKNVRRSQRRTSAAVERLHNNDGFRRD